jgi:predicted alpha/beta-hydrolase family hydrolase
MLIDNPEGSPTIVLAHGAGAPMDSDFMNEITARLSGHGFKVVRFEFPYMAERRTGGKKRPPNGARVLEETWRSVVDELGETEQLIIGGKSMGGRIASRLADELGVAGLICLGYPFHPVRKPEKLRTAHLADLTTPTLICQGTRDRFGTPEEVATYDLSTAVEVFWIPDGDHSFVPRKRSGRTPEQNLDLATDRIVDWLNARHGS